MQFDSAWPLHTLSSRRIVLVSIFITYDDEHDTQTDRQADGRTARQRSPVERNTTHRFPWLYTLARLPTGLLLLFSWLWFHAIPGKIQRLRRSALPSGQLEILLHRIIWKHVCTVGLNSNINAGKVEEYTLPSTRTVAIPMHMEPNLLGTSPQALYRNRTTKTTHTWVRRSVGGRS
jgi:hypothetical protein